MLEFMETLLFILMYLRFELCCWDINMILEMLFILLCNFDEKINMHILEFNDEGPGACINYFLYLY